MNKSCQICKDFVILNKLPKLVCYVELVYVSLKLIKNLNLRVVNELVRESIREWNPGNYPHLHTPISASVVLQWVIRSVL